MSDGTILVCGGLADKVTELVCARLADCGYPYRLLDLAYYPRGYEIRLHWQGGSPRGFIAGPDWRLELDEIRSVFCRFLGLEGRAPWPDLTVEQAQSLYAEGDCGLVALFESLPCPVVNRVEGGMTNNSKPLQALQVRRCGLRTPPTLVTNDPAAARQFYEEHNGEVIYKSLSGVRSIVRRLGPEQLERLPLLRNGPAQFQAFIPGDNVRVHTVGEQLFATLLASEAVDYRYARQEGHDTKMQATTLPPEIAAACHRLARDTDLLLAGIDLKVTPAGEYYCFEINPVPGFLYYEHGGGQPISAALAELLQYGLPSPKEEDAHGLLNGVPAIA